MARGTCIPDPFGAKVISNVVDSLERTIVSGFFVTQKSPAFVPVSLTIGVPVSLSSKSPRFWIVKLLTTFPLTSTLADPKSVPSALLGVVSLFGMFFPFP